ncbi:MAG: NADH:flavin oxidoreductase [Synergistaceae bacterium]|jgi:2,4-dienoyl-CoA reductase-like NADH-dependent reductase (Old Yellow Enzyme family)|nr:NADH:flavin oxidoreductase [Synergistaceae bacterium]
MVCANVREETSGGKKTMFDSIALSQLKINGRVIRSATFENSGEPGGKVPPRLRDFYENLVKGGAGVIITGMMGVGYNSGVNRNMAKIYGDGFAAEFEKVAEAVHRLGGKVIVQLGHCGAKASDIDRGEGPYAPSEVTVGKGIPAKALSKDEIKELVAQYGLAALKCKSAGADGVQIHGAHGYLISQFLSPYFNKREDEYGGSLENRSRFLFETYEEIRARVGSEYPIWIKINSDDLTPGGLTLDECSQICGKLDSLGIDAIELSGGIMTDKDTSPSRPVKTEEDEGSFAASALRISSEIRTPVISVGGYRTPDVIERKLNEGNIAAVSLCRPLICEPDLLNRWRSGDRTKSRCVSCNKCFMIPMLGCNLRQQ